ncbi:MAG TPA: helix-turn-helix transcriptional regulator [Streptosporangiaceae bacterium]|nr:helix-turn-helix transcriptional regulator [Streptosporangiaceae bacterium]
MTTPTTPQQPPEMELIRRRREDAVPRLSMREAARRAGISSPWWRVLETGIRRVKGQDFPESANDETLARMALVVGVTAEELAAAGRPGAAARLGKLADAGPDPAAQIAEIVRQSPDFSNRQKRHLIELLERGSR